MSETSATVLGYAARLSYRRRARLALLLAAAVVVLLLLPSGARHAPRKLRHSGRPVSTTIQAVNADSGMPLPITIGGPPLGTTDPWSVTYTTTGDVSKIRLAR